MIAKRRSLFSKYREEKGFTLIELIIVLGILGGLIAFLVGSLGGNQRSAKIKESNMRASTVYGKLLVFQSDVGRFPTKAEGLGALSTNPGNSKWHGPYLAEDETNDSWNNPFEYDLEPGKGPKLVSPGEDGISGNEDDLVYINGKAVEAHNAAPAAGGN